MTTQSPEVELAMSDALDIADRLIERGYGLDVPQEWNDAYKAVALARRALPVVGGEETGWLMERAICGPVWWAGFSAEDQRDGDGWTKDSLIAMRFARQRDAQAYIDDVGWNYVRATEHSWPQLKAAAPKPSNPPIVGEQVEALISAARAEAVTLRRMCNAKAQDRAALFDRLADRLRITPDRPMLAASPLPSPVEGGEELGSVAAELLPGTIDSDREPAGACGFSALDCANGVTRRLAFRLEDLLEVLRQWEPDHASAEHRRLIFFAREARRDADAWLKRGQYIDAGPVELSLDQARLAGSRHPVASDGEGSVGAAEAIPTEHKPSTPLPEGDRAEAIARIIDPEGWRTVDDRLARNDRTPSFAYIAGSLAKARQIIALALPEGREAKLVEALKPFGQTSWPDAIPDDAPGNTSLVTVGDYRRARAALAEATGETGVGG